RGPAGESFDAIAAIAERLITIIDQTKPDVVVTWGPDGLTGHPRHILVSNVVTRVFQQRRLVAAAPRKLYYIAYPESRFAEKPDFGRHHCHRQLEFLHRCAGIRRSVVSAPERLDGRGETSRA